jgi:hypothetical protein
VPFSRPERGVVRAAARRRRASTRWGPPCSNVGESLGESATDDNAADVSATPRDAGMIQTTGPRRPSRPRAWRSTPLGSMFLERFGAFDGPANVVAPTPAPGTRPGGAGVAERDTVRAQAPDQYDGQIGESVGRVSDVVAGTPHDQDIRIARSPVACTHQPPDDIVELDGRDSGHVVGRAQADHAPGAQPGSTPQERDPGGAAGLQGRNEGVRPPGTSWSEPRSPRP